VQSNRLNLQPVDIIGYVGTVTALIGLFVNE